MLAQSQLRKSQQLIYCFFFYKIEQAYTQVSGIYKFTCDMQTTVVIIMTILISTIITIVTIIIILIIITIILVILSI